MDMSPLLELSRLGQRARAANRLIACASTVQKNAALTVLAEALAREAPALLAANAADVAAAQVAGREPWLVDRLTLNEKRLAGIVADVRQLVALPDPVGERFDEQVLANGLRLRRQRVPLGVLGVVYEARPNVTVDVAALAIKTGNAAILRGGSETLRSNVALLTVIQEALTSVGLPADVIQLITDPDRARIFELLQLHEYVDVIIPRGGAALHKLCREHAKMPVIVGGVGIGHLFFDASADLERALPVIVNAKTQRPSVCNSLDTLLVHEAVAARVLPRVVAALAPLGVTFRADAQALSALLEDGGRELVNLVSPAGPGDWDREWMSLVLGLKVVSGLDEAIDHIAAHSLNHSDGILTEDRANAERFMAEVDSSAVFWNASTRFNDGGQFGLGAEVAVSTQRLHVRGPMGLRELTTYKWVGEGDYHVRG